jgi:Tfp pilus assembly protein PilV
MQKGQTLIEVVLSLLILSLSLLCSGFVTLKSIQASKHALEHTQIVLCLENIATRFELLQSHRVSENAYDKELQQSLTFCQSISPSLEFHWQISQDIMRCSLTFQDTSEKMFHKYRQFTIDKYGVIHF